MDAMSNWPPLKNEIQCNRSIISMGDMRRRCARTPICTARHKPGCNEAPKQRNKRRIRSQAKYLSGWRPTTQEANSDFTFADVTREAAHCIYALNTIYLFGEHTQNLVHKYMWKHISSIGMQTGLVSELCNRAAHCRNSARSGRNA